VVLISDIKIGPKERNIYDRAVKSATEVINPKGRLIKAI